MATYYKLVNANMTNRGFTFVEGANALSSEDLEAFDDEGEECGPGLYFTDLESIPYWATQMFAPDSFVFKVEIPSSAPIKLQTAPLEYSGRNKWKTTVMWLSEKMPLMDFIEKHGLQQAILKDRSTGLTYIRDHDPALCLYAVKQWPSALQYVGTINCPCPQTPEMCFIAVRSSPDAFQYVKNQTLEICSYVVEKDASLMSKVENRSYSFILEMVNANSMVLKYCYSDVERLEPQQANEICLTAVSENGYALEYVAAHLQTPEICEAAVRWSGAALQYVKAINCQQYPELCLLAAARGGLKYVKKQTSEICLAAVRADGGALALVNEQTFEICLEAVRQDGTMLYHVKRDMFTPQEYAKIRAAAIQQYPLAARLANKFGTVPWLSDVRMTPELEKIIAEANK